MPEPIVAIRHLNKSYRRGNVTIPVLHDITFDIEEGDPPERVREKVESGITNLLGREEVVTASTPSPRSGWG